MKMKPPVQKKSENHVKAKSSIRRMRLPLRGDWAALVVTRLIELTALLLTLLWAVEARACSVEKAQSDQGSGGQNQAYDSSREPTSVQAHGHISPRSWGRSQSTGSSRRAHGGHLWLRDPRAYGFLGAQKFHTLSAWGGISPSLSSSPLTRQGEPGMNESSVMGSAGVQDRNPAATFRQLPYYVEPQIEVFRFGGQKQLEAHSH
ncbi:MAG: hypothetical protein ACO3A2_09510 [Bdellovibrionia bacterium]